MAGKEETEKEHGGGLASPLDSLLGYRLRRASMAMMVDAMGALTPLGLSAGEASFLIVVGANPGCRQSDLGRTLEIKRANMTPLVARMKARGLVTDAPIDGRSRSLTLTASGIALRDKALARIDAAHRKVRQTLTIDESALLAALRSISG
ncbi:MAG: MarR family transcriptional regulator [Sphingobium sp.]|nr:MarR family transcriptional regulator [Sphingobium sp.]